MNSNRRTSGFSYTDNIYYEIDKHFLPSHNTKNIKYYHTFYLKTIKTAKSSSSQTLPSDTVSPRKAQTVAPFAVSKTNKVSFRQKTKGGRFNNSSQEKLKLFHCLYILVVSNEKITFHTYVIETTAHAESLWRVSAVCVTVRSGSHTHLHTAVA